MTGLSPEDERRLAEMVARVLASAEQNQVWLEIIVALETSQAPELVCALFESLAWRIHIINYWIYSISAASYATLKRNDAAFLLSAFADRLEKNSQGSYNVCSMLFNFFQSNGRAAEALDVFFDCLRRFPERPIAEAWHVIPLAQKTGRSLSTLFGKAQFGVGPGQRRNIPIAGATPWQAWTCPVYGGRRALPLEPLATARTRPAVFVAYLPQAEVLICNHSYAIVDSAGGVHGDLSVHDFPMALKDHIYALRPENREVEIIDIDAAVITGDRFSAVNLCHFLLDHLTRLQLYERAGAKPGEVTVIDAEASAEFQNTSFLALGVRRFLSTGRTARVRVQRLWVSSNCRELEHSAHMGANWAIAFLRNRLVRDVPPQRGRIYVSRRDAATRRVTNENEVMNLLRKFNFELICPGEMPFRQQVDIFAGARYVVGPHGAGLANLAFCPPGTKVLELFHPLYGTPAYAYVASGGALNYSAMMCRDGQSDAPEFNDAADNTGPRPDLVHRDITVDLDQLNHWICDTIASDT